MFQGHHAFFWNDVVNKMTANKIYSTNNLLFKMTVVAPVKAEMMVVLQIGVKYSLNLFFFFLN